MCRQLALIDGAGYQYFFFMCQTKSLLLRVLKNILDWGQTLNIQSDSQIILQLIPNQDLF